MTTTQLDTITSGDVQAAIDAGTAVAKPQPLDAAKRFHVLTTPAGGDVQVVDLAGHDGWLERPERKRGTVTVHDAASFVTYMGKHALTQSEVYADVTTPVVIGVINAHDGVTADGVEDYAGWGDHRVRLQLHRTLAWKAWLNLNHKLMSQVEFAEHLEERLVDIVEPAAADLLELAQSFSAKRGVTFESSHRLSTGEVQVEYRETDTASAGKKGRLAWQEKFALAIRLFEGGPACRITGRLRYRMNDGTLKIGYLLDRPEDAERAVFDDLVAEIDKGTKAPLIQGVPAA